METKNSKGGQLGSRELTICGRFTRREGPSERVPELRLMGKWLKETFAIGTRVLVTCADGKLIIEPAKDQPWLGKQKTVRLVREEPDDVAADRLPVPRHERINRRPAAPARSGRIRV